MTTPSQCLMIVSDQTSVPDCLLMNCWLRLQFVLLPNWSVINQANSSSHFPPIVTTTVALWLGWFNSCISFNKGNSYKQSYIIQLVQFVQILSILIEVMQLCNLSKCCITFNSHTSYIRSERTHVPRRPCYCDCYLSLLSLYQILSCDLCVPCCRYQSSPPRSLPCPRHDSMVSVTNNQTYEEEGSGGRGVLSCYNSLEKSNRQNNTFCTFPWWVHQHKEDEDG